ncbi:hypothetical protein [Bacteroides sp.]|uniref:hypothetical protein n=1 Tax=Bacteroides sp. TaxID=29523 RepID=UPI0026227FC0|nr:hypothetical protein [Bacteroides sp.]MDD3039693.1 hypothetical protein [Bacteroides sp.]
MAVRNFWVEASIDGRESKVAGGPRAKTDGMTTTIYQRDNGEIVTAFKIVSRVNSKGKLLSEVHDSNNKLVLTFTTER